MVTVGQFSKEAHCKGKKIPSFLSKKSLFRFPISKMSVSILKVWWETTAFLLHRAPSKTPREQEQRMTLVLTKGGVYHTYRGTIWSERQEPSFALQE